MFSETTAATLPVIGSLATKPMAAAEMYHCPFRVSLEAFAVGESGRVVGGLLLMPKLGSIVISLPVKSQAGLCCTMTIVVVPMQVLTSRRDRFMAQVVPHVSQIDLAIHHARASRVS